MSQTLRRFIILVLDGFGVGAMEDIVGSRPQDIGAHTFRHLIEAVPNIHLPNFQSLGAYEYFFENRFQAKDFMGAHVSFGKAKLAHFGADSYVGHQEIAGTLPQKPVRQFVREVQGQIIDALHQAGFAAEFRDKMIFVDSHIAVADNIETDYGLNINVVGSLDFHPYETFEKIGRVVRSVVNVGRVITMGGVEITSDDLLRCFEEKTRDGYTAWGINIPKLGIYNEKYRVIHMGYGIDAQTQAPQILANQNHKVVLIGKAADVIQVDKAIYSPEVDTTTILNTLIAHLEKNDADFIFANVQQTDLSGHEMNPEKYAKYLEIVDSYLPRIVQQLGPEDILIITGDHGNDPTIGHTNHTRECTPIIFFSRSSLSRNLGIRETLADIGATATAYFNANQPQSGKSFLE